MTPTNGIDNDNEHTDDGNSNPTIVDKSLPILHERLQQMRTHIHLEQQLRHPPNSNLSPCEFISSLLHILKNPDDPIPDAGYRTLLQSSSPKWHTQLCRSIGAPPPRPSLSSFSLSSTNQTRDHNEEQNRVASALGAAMMRPNNQFGILVQAEDAEKYTLTFPNGGNEGNSNRSPSGVSEEVDILDYEDGTCWVVCELRDVVSEELLVVLGWELVRSCSNSIYNNSSVGEMECREVEEKDHETDDGAWLVESLTWQDFRDAYRPGIGREEW
eukprot:CAMPEP_0198263086 /NCGR_PEP_ID=MMETSP1447-20131203/11501_1 /TAXON_ID=420782 /ORGANISM="Chaetoceros dichaeta, Strain CCMP1751" /LENGTH=270 /DNA_ID=CAMNT_0043951563 /DNA_START=261 /DNA_END=1070 /DNA_ORIENTATION=+